MGLLPGTYDCCVTDANGCVSCDTVTIFSVLAIGESSSDDIYILDNPVDDKISIVIPEHMQTGLLVKLFDIAGKEFVTPWFIHDNIAEVDVTEFPKGMYFVQLYMQKKSRIFKIIRQ